MLIHGSVVFRVLIRLDNSSKLLVVPSISLKALISALISVKSDLISVDSVGIIVFPVGDGRGEDFVKVMEVSFASGLLSSLVRTKKVKPKLIRHKKKIITKTLAYFSIFMLFLNIA